MMVSTERIRSLSDWFNGVGALAVPGEELACEVKAALDELLAYREGHDPRERMPEAGQVVRIEYRFPGSYTRKPQDVQKLARYDGKEFADLIYADTCIPLSWLTRWYPLPGGEG